MLKHLVLGIRFHLTGYPSGVIYFYLCQPAFTDTVGYLSGNLASTYIPAYPDYVRQFDPCLPVSSDNTGYSSYIASSPRVTTHIDKLALFVLGGGGEIGLATRNLIKKPVF